MKKSIRRFEDLTAWEKGMQLAVRVYHATLKGELSKDFVMKDQMRRAALSIPSNVAEGFERGRRDEFHQFLSVAKSSCAELRTQIYISRDIGYIPEDAASAMLKNAEEVARILGGLREAVAKQTSRRLPRTQYSVLSTQY